MLQFRTLIEVLEARQMLSADLVGSFKGKVPASVSLKTPTKVTFHIVNSGTTAVTSSASLFLFASLDSTLDTGDPLLATSKVKLNLKPGKSTDVTEIFSAPFAVNSGSYSLIGDVDGAPLVESSIANNIFLSTTRVTVTKPTVDLVGTVSVSPKTTTYTVGGKAQKPLALTINVTNRGNIPAKGPIFVNVFGSTNTTLDTLDPQLTKIPTKKITLNPNKSMKFTLNFKPTASTPSGKFYGIVDVNAGTTIQTAIAETNINNDTAITSSTFTISNAAIPFKARLVGGLAHDISAIVVGSPEQVTFSAVVANASAGTAVEVDEVDSAGNLIGKISDLHDSGSVGDGDAAAGDGTFSVKVAIGFDVPGTRYFLAKVTDSSATTQTAATSIPGVNAPSAQQLAQDRTDGETAVTAAAAIAAAHGTAAQIIASVQAGLQSDQNVKPGSISTTTTSIMWETNDGILQLVNTDAMLGNRGASQPAQTLGTVTPSAVPRSERAASSPVIRPADNIADGQTAVVLDPYNFDFTQEGAIPTNDEAPTIAQSLTAAGYDTTYLANTDPLTPGITKLADFQNLGSNAAVVIVSHGETDPIHGSFVGTYVDDAQDPMANHTSDLVTNRLAMSYDGYSLAADRVVSNYAVGSAFFARYTGSMDGTIVYLGACHLGENMDMPGTFLNLGAGAVIAYTGIVPSTWAGPHGVEAFQTLLKPDHNTVGDIPGINTDQLTREQTVPVPEPPPEATPSVRHLSPDGLSIKGPPATTIQTYLVTNEFLAFGDLKATLPGRPLLTNVNLIVTYSWPNNQKDLDSRTTFNGQSDGFNLDGGTYLKWLGDEQGAGLQETTIIDLYDAWKAGIFDKSTTVGVGADWYTPDEGKGPATISIALEDIHTRQQYQIQSLIITPGTETNGATSQQGTITVTLGGDPTNPTITVKLGRSV